MLVEPVVKSGPRKDSTRISWSGTVRRWAVAVSPMRRINVAAYLTRCPSVHETGLRQPSGSMRHQYSNQVFVFVNNRADHVNGFIVVQGHLRVD